ncbi:MAG: hypothetical protein IJR46_06150 [Neisseriaceae bacterium]|nr:hypothetical protein [Neisseriaceae bacterium]
MHIRVDLPNGKFTNDFPIVDFMNSIYKKNYVWNISYIDFIAKNGSFDNTNYSIDSIEDEINNAKPNGLFVSWDKLMFILKSAFQIYDVTISAFENEMEIMKFEIFDCSSIEITTENNKIANQFDNAVNIMKTYLASIGWATCCPPVLID